MKNKKPEIRNMSVKMRLFPSEFELLRKKAEGHCLTVSGYLRRLISHETPSCKEDIQSNLVKEIIAIGKEKEVFEMVLRAILYVSASAKDSLTPELLEESNTTAKELRRKLGYD